VGKVALRDFAHAEHDNRVAVIRVGNGKAAVAHPTAAFMHRLAQHDGIS